MPQGCCVGSSSSHTSMSDMSMTTHDPVACFCRCQSHTSLTSASATVAWTSKHRPCLCCALSSRPALLSTDQLGLIPSQQHQRSLLSVSRFSAADSCLAHFDSGSSIPSPQDAQGEQSGEDAQFAAEQPAAHLPSAASPASTFRPSLRLNSLESCS